MEISFEMNEFSKLRSSDTVFRKFLKWCIIDILHLWEWVLIL